MNLCMRRRLYAARELVEIAIIEACLDALDVSLHFEHPTLDDCASLGDPPTLKRARAVDRYAHALRGAIHSYRRTVQAAIDKESDELPF